MTKVIEDGLVPRRLLTSGHLTTGPSSVSSKLKLSIVQYYRVPTLIKRKEKIKEKGDKTKSERDRETCFRSFPRSPYRHCREKEASSENSGEATPFSRLRFRQGS